jgi:tetratricopeptide (TPR) repeat protein
MKILNKKQYDYKSHIGIALIYYKRGKVRWAIDKLKYVVQREPSNIEALVYLGKFLEEVGNGKKAEWCFERARELNPQNPILHKYEGEAYLRRYIREKETTFLKRAIYDLSVAYKISYSQEVIEYLTTAYILAKRYDEAIKVLERAKSIYNKGDIEFLYGYVYLKKYEEEGDKTSLTIAISHLGTALKWRQSDDLLRSFLELLVITNRVSIYHPVRVSLAEYRESLADYLLNNYRLRLGYLNLIRAKLLNPKKESIRQKLLKIYKQNYFFVSYLRELKVLRKLYSDSIEYKDLLEIALSKRRKLFFYKERLDEHSYAFLKKKIVVLSFISYDVGEIWGIGKNAVADFLYSFMKEDMPYLVFREYKNRELFFSDIQKQKDIGYVLWGKYKKIGDELTIKFFVEDYETKNILFDKEYSERGKDALTRICARFLNSFHSVVKKEGTILKVVNDNVIINLGLRDGIDPKKGLFFLKGVEKEYNKELDIVEVSEFFSLAKFKDYRMRFFVYKGGKVLFVTTKNKKEK